MENQEPFVRKPSNGFCNKSEQEFCLEGRSKIVSERKQTRFKASLHAVWDALLLENDIHDVG